MVVRQGSCRYVTWRFVHLARKLRVHRGTRTGHNLQKFISRVTRVRDWVLGALTGQALPVLNKPIKEASEW